MTDRYAVVGNPVAHSKSPQIHAEFARQTGQDMAYERLPAALDGFTETVEAFRRAGGRGLNVTVPFKEEAFRYASHKTARAEAARAVNTLKFENGEIVGDNTDGAGLVRDIAFNLNFPLQGKSVLLVGAGGAGRGVAKPLLDQEPSRLVIVNRNVNRADDLIEMLGYGRGYGLSYGKTESVIASDFESLDSTFDLVINATSASLKGELPPLPDNLFNPGALAYDMMYGAETPFMAWAGAHGATKICDGLGMLVEQAAESFYLWRGVRPDTAPVIRMLRAA